MLLEVSWNGCRGLIAAPSPSLDFCFRERGWRWGYHEPRKSHRAAANPFHTTAGKDLYTASFLLLLTCLYMFL